MRLSKLFSSYWNLSNRQLLVASSTQATTLVTSTWSELSLYQFSIAEMPTPEETCIETLAEDTTSTVGAAMPPSVAAVSMKLPPFWPTDSTVWFAQVEAQLSTRGIISQKTRFEYIISSLSPEFAVEVRDLLLQPPAENPYDKLKQELVNEQLPRSNASSNSSSVARRQKAYSTPQTHAAAPGVSYTWGKQHFSPWALPPEAATKRKDALLGIPWTLIS